MKMQMKKLATSVALGLALAGSMGMAQAAASMTLDTWTSTLTELTAQWTVAADAGASSFSNMADPNWRLSFTAMVLGSGTGTTINIDSLDVFHFVAPHVGETSPGPTWSITAVTSTYGVGSYGATLAHGGHADIYDLKLTGNAGGSTTVNLHAVHAVPEPETYAMMLAGLGIIGAIARRRKTRIG